MQTQFDNDPYADAAVAVAEPDTVIEEWTVDELDRFADLVSLRAACSDANYDGA